MLACGRQVDNLLACGRQVGRLLACGRQVDSLLACGRQVDLIYFPEVNCVTYGLVNSQSVTDVWRVLTLFMYVKHIMAG